MKFNEAIYLKSYISGQRTKVEFDGFFSKGFPDMYVSNKIYLFAIYGSSQEKNQNKRSLGNKVLVYNWDGEPVKTFSLDKDIGCFTIDSNESIIWLSDERRAGTVCI